MQTTRVQTSLEELYLESPTWKHVQRCVWNIPSALRSHTRHGGKFVSHVLVCASPSYTVQLPYGGM